MAKHLDFGEGLTPSANDDAVRGTYLGQAHIAGTGPEGRTCRECIHYWPKGYDDGGNFGERREFAYCGRGDDGPLHLADARCNRPILNKADRVYPHCAKACRLFELNESAPPATRERLRKRRAA